LLHQVGTSRHLHFVGLGLGFVDTVPGEMSRNFCRFQPLSKVPSYAAKALYRTPLQGCDVLHPTVFFKRLIYCSEMYKFLHEFSIKTVPDTSLHETSDLLWAIEVYYVETTFMLKAVKKLSLQ